MVFRQKFSRFILCLTLSISVFFCNYSFSFASEIDPADYIGFEVDAGQSRSVPLMGSFVDDTVIYGETYLNNYFTIILKAGYVYTGQITARFTITFTPDTNTVSYLTLLSDHAVRSSLSDVGVAFDVYNKRGDVWTCDLLITFNGVYAETDLPVTISYTTLCICSGNRSGTLDNLIGSFYVSGAEDYASRNWTATLPDAYDVGGVISDIGQQQMNQQQQIAEQQAQQSAQQHDDLKNGFQDDTYNSNVSNAGNTVDSYISVESDLMNSQNQIMSNYTDTAFNTGTLAPFTNAIAMCSTWYTWIWNSFGELNVAFVVVLAVGVACLIVGIKKRG